ncbi:MAG: cytochrome P460 family protein [Desulfobacterales bacterium]
MKTTLMGLIGGLAVIFLVTIAVHFDGPAISAENYPAPDAQEVWEYMQEKNYTEWQSIPGYPGIFGKTNAESPHGAFLKLHLNDVAIFSLQKDFEEMIHRSMFVMENFSKDDDETPEFVTVQYKYEGYSPDGGDWFWAQYEPDGTVINAGKVESCIQCHSQTDYKDYLLVVPDQKIWEPSPPVGATGGGL